METTAKTQGRFWLLVLLGLVLLFWLFRPVLFPFISGLTIAYFLEPLVSKLEKRKWPRWLGAFVVLVVFFLIVVAISLLIWPMLSDQFVALMNAFPEYINTVRNHYLPWMQRWLARFAHVDAAQIRDAAQQTTGQAVDLVSRAVRGIVSGGFAVIDAIAVSILTPITAFYALRDWRKLVDVINSLIPGKYYDVVREQMCQIDYAMAGFIRGEAMVALTIGIIYSAGLAATGLQYGPTVGLISGLLSIMPYVGTVFGFITSFILAMVQFSGDWLHIGAVVGVYAVGHLFETYVLTPRWVGNRVGLHPIWILFALLAGAKLGGFLGVLVAVPAAAAIGVLVRFGVQRYKASSLYR